MKLGFKNPLGRSSVVRVCPTLGRGDFEYCGDIPAMDDRVRPLNAFLINNSSLQTEQTEIHKQSPSLTPLPGKKHNLNDIDLASLPEEKGRNIKGQK